MKKLRPRDLPGVAKETGISVPGLVKIYYGTTKYPQLPNIKKLVAYFIERAA